MVYQAVPGLAEWDGPRRPGSPTPRAFLSWLWKDTPVRQVATVSPNITRETDNITLRCLINDNALVNLRWAPISRAERASMKQGDFQWLLQIETFINLPTLTSWRLVRSFRGLCKMGFSWKLALMLGHGRENSASNARGSTAKEK